MCNVIDAKRHEELARIYESENNMTKAKEHWLEAASIYVLQADLQKNDHLLEHSNQCYSHSKRVQGITFTELLNKQQLARRTLMELEEVQGKRPSKVPNNSLGASSEAFANASVENHVSQGKKAEEENPEKAAQHYLEAANLLLEESNINPGKEDEYVNLANRMYLRAKDLKGKKKVKIKPVKKDENKITFEDIGGLEELKQEIRFKIIEPFRNPEIFQFYGKPVGGGILMYGPPGCGKSLIAKATANEADCAFFHVKSSDLKSKFVGETEKNIAELFKKAREVQPSIIFFDEFEALGGDRSEGQSHERSAVAQLLTEMDGMDSKDQKILLLAATNEPWAVDPALRREGRFGRTLFIPQPDDEAREQIFEIHLDPRPTEDVNYEKLGELTQGFSGADLKAICERATDIPLKEALMGGERRAITMNDLQLAIDSTQSVMEQWFAKARQMVASKNLEESFKELTEVAQNKERMEV